MSDITIKVENIGKRYRLGVQAERKDTLGATAVSWLKSPLGNYRRLRSLSHFDNDEAGDDVLWALKDVSFEVKRGEVLGIIGRNGAGKSTLLKILSRITPPTTGSITLNGRVASLLEVGTGFHPELTGRENVYLNGTILGMRKAEIDRKFDEIVDFSGIEKFIDTPVKRYSSGMNVRLAFSVAAHLEPEILLIDEVLAVGDVAFQKKCLGKMGEIATQGRTILFVSHQMAAIENLCNRVILIEHGNLTKNDTPTNTIKYYLHAVSEPLLRTKALENRTDRTGTGDIILTGFHIEDNKGNLVETIRNGSDVSFIFDYKGNTETSLQNIDIGFSIHSGDNDQTLTVLYASYVNDLFPTVPANGSFRCHVPNFPFASGRYKIGARITANNIETDWLREGIGFIDVADGDFYRSGRSGFDGKTPFLLTGQWQIEN